MFYTPTVPLSYTNLLSVPEIALMNIMACLVYRNVRFGIFREAARHSSLSGSLGSSGRGNTQSGLVFSPNPRHVPQISRRRSSPLEDVESGQIGLQKHRNVQIELDGMRSDVDTMDQRTSLGEDKSGYWYHIRNKNVIYFSLVIPSSVLSEKIISNKHQWSRLLVNGITFYSRQLYMNVFAMTLALGNSDASLSTNSVHHWLSSGVERWMFTDFTVISV